MTTLEQAQYTKALYCAKHTAHYKLLTLLSKPFDRKPSFFTYIYYMLMRMRSLHAGKVFTKVYYIEKHRPMYDNEDDRKHALMHARNTLRYKFYYTLSYGLIYCGEKLRHHAHETFHISYNKRATKLTRQRKNSETKMKMT